MSLREYHRKRDFEKTAEPRGAEHEGTGWSFLVQKHAASRLHYDLRLELNGVLLSWAVPKGPSLDPGEKRLAVHVEDHPLEYGGFEGVIPAGEYGGGTVMLWDRGTWEPLEDARKGYRKGHLKFRLHGERLRGDWHLVRIHGDEKNWLLFKSKDDEARETGDVLDELTSVASGRTMEEIAAEKDAVWHSRELDPSELEGAKKGPFPSELRPQLAQLGKVPPPGDQWLHELKYDGYRLLAMIDNGKPRLLTRTHQDWTHRYPNVAAALTKLPVNQAVLDGEVVILRKDGTTDFQALQRGAGEPVYYVFDLPYCQGHDLKNVPLWARKRFLKQVVEGQGPVVRFSDHVEGQGEAFFAQAQQLRIEGIISKRKDAPYEERRSTQWLKLKCQQNQEFVIGGYTEPGGSREGFGALLLGHYEDGDLRWCGKVGTGFDQRCLATLTPRLQKLERKTPPFVNPPTGAQARGVYWVTPELVAQVEFMDWTEDGVLRHPSFKGLREDKPAREVQEEVPVKKPVAGVTISNPDRVVYPDNGVTKGELAEYYERAAERMLPHVAGRPLSLFRCPQGIDKQCFYQKHLADGFPKSVRGVPVVESDGTELHLCIDNAEGLLALIQFGGMEIHPWGCLADRLDRPDRLILDLDPAPDVPWKTVVEATLEVGRMLADLGLVSFPKTTGGKGMHVVAPLVRRCTWDELKGFTKAVAERLEAENPQRYVSVMTKAKRTGRVFVDYLRNGEGATAVGAYSTRAREGAPVSAPLSWDEVTSKMKPTDFTVRTMKKRLGGSDPWEGFLDLRQSLTQAMLSSLA